MSGPYKRSLTVVVGSVLGLLLLLGLSSPAAAVKNANGGTDVTACGSFTAADGSRFDIAANILAVGNCLSFPPDSVVYLNGFVIVGPGLDSGSTGIRFERHGVLGASDAFLWGPGIVRGFTNCVVGGDDVAVEGVHFNQCGIGIALGDSYKIKEVMIHDCTPSTLEGIGMFLGTGGFVESSIVRACDIGVFSFRNNKYWNLVVTRSLLVGLFFGGGGNAVSRTVISHPRSVATVGLDYTNCGPAGSTAAGGGVGCQDGSNSVSGHTPGFNIVLGAPAAVVTQGQDRPDKSATNCNGVPGTRNPNTGLFVPVGPLGPNGALSAC